jgi:prepilin signal peptidase PulO-like enzyme (type II secretory pathway)
LELLAGISGLLFLSYGSYYDLKKREVEDNVWKWMLVVACGFNVLRLIIYFGQTTWMTTLVKISVSMILGIILAFIVIILGLWGGADAKAMICIAIMSPLSPLVFDITTSSGRIMSIFSDLIPFSITIFMNAFILTFPIPIILLSYNILNYKKRPTLYRDKYPLWKKIAASCLGYPSFLHDIRKKHLWKYDVLEVKNEQSKSFNAHCGRTTNEWRKISAKVPSLNQRIVNTGKISFIRHGSLLEEHKWKLNFQIGLGDETDDEQKRISAIKAAHREGKNKLWLLYTIPFLVPLTLGYLLSLFAGNLILNFYTWILYGL